MTWAGKQSEQPRSFQSPETYLLLTFPFIERACIHWCGQLPGVGNSSLIIFPVRHPVGGEFRKFPEFLSFFSLIPSSACATFSLFFCMPSLSSSGLVDPVGSDLLLPNPS